jgi:hypothetical protein
MYIHQSLWCTPKRAFGVHRKEPYVHRVLSKYVYIYVYASICTLPLCTSKRALRTLNRVRRLRSSMPPTFRLLCACTYKVQTRKYCKIYTPTQQDTATHTNLHIGACVLTHILHTYHNTQRHAATHWVAFQRAATRCHKLQHAASTAAHWNTHMHIF